MDEDYDDPYLRESYRHYTQELLHDQSVSNQLQSKYWSAKSFVKKLKKKEDESVVAADADLDAKLEFFKSIQETTQSLIFCIERYQDAIMALSQEENKLGRFLKEQAQVDKTPAGKIMSAIGKQLSQTSQQRLSCRVPLVRLYGDLDTFRNRAISDSVMSVQRMEALRTEYRGALLRMKDISSELNPDAYRQLERFRKVQAQVKINRDKFEKNKHAVCQKIDLLGASRCNLLSHDLEVYHQNMVNFWQKTAKEMSSICEQFKGHQQYEFSMLKELNDPSAKLQEQLEKSSKGPGDKQTVDGVKSDDNKETDEDKLINWDGGDESGSYFDAETPASADDFDFFKESLGDSEKDGMDFLDQFMNSATGSTSGASGNSAPSGFASEWKSVFGDEESGQVTGGSAGGFTSGMDSSFLPSQLFDMPMEDFGSFNQTQYPNQNVPMSGNFNPGAPSSGGAQTGKKSDKHPPKSRSMQQSSAGNSSTNGNNNANKSGGSGGGGKQKADMSAWFDLFADLDPLANPDAVGDSTKREEKIGI